MQLIESQGPITKKDLKTNKALIEEFTKHSQEYHNPREDITRRKENLDRGNKNLALVLAKLDTMDQRIMKMG